MRYFLDTFAIMEIIKGNPKYKKYLDDDLFTSLMNLYEMYYNLLGASDEKSAKEKFFQFIDFTVPINDSHIFLASKFRMEIKSGVSYVDALGYAIAKQGRMKFLTGDRAFKDINNVEFVG